MENQNDELTAVLQRKLDSKLATGKAKVIGVLQTLKGDLDKSRDFIVPFNRKNADLWFQNEEDHVSMNFRNVTDGFRIHDHAVSQLGEKLSIPTQYLRSLVAGDDEHRALAIDILSSHKGWTKDDRRLLVRAIDQEVRGVLSDSYKRLDSKQIVNTFVKTISEQGAVPSDACYTPTKFWIETLIPKIFSIPTEKNGTVGISFGARIANSDFGDGALDLRSFFLQPICANGAVRESLMNKIHIGKKLPDNIALSDKTYRLDSELMASIVKDVAKKALDRAMIEDNISLIQAAGGTLVNLDREFLLLSTKQVNQNEIREISNIMIQNNQDDGLFGDATLWKLSQGITAFGRNAGGQRERELAEIAGKLLERVKEKA
jgi:hypothetical protein